MNASGFRRKLARKKAVLSNTIRYAAVLAVLWSFMESVHAVSISPVLVELSPARRVASVSIMNDAPSAVRFQADTLAWMQDGGSDRYAKTDKLIVAPAIAEIAPGGIQIFRVMLRQPLVPGEQAFRLIFEDITHVEAQPGIVALRFNHNLPVFFNGSAKPKGLARLGTCVPRAAGCVRIDNGGGRYVVIESLIVEGKGWRKDLKASTRLLGGAWRQWTFKPPATAKGPITVKAATSSGLLSMELPPLAK